MSEGNNNINSENIKKEAKDTVNQVKDSFKNVDVKQESIKAKNFFSDIFKSPTSKIKEIAHDNTNGFFKTALILVIVWAVIALLLQIISTLKTLINLGADYITFSDYVKIFRAIITPVLIVVIMSGIVYVFNTKNKKSFLTTLNTIVAAYFPTVIAEVVSILNLIPSAYRITSPVIGLLGVVTLIFTFFAVKELFDEENNDTIVKQFILIEAVYYVIDFILSFLSIYI